MKNINKSTKEYKENHGARRKDNQTDPWLTMRLLGIVAKGLLLILNKELMNYGL